jgi:hypothetical protein
MMSSLNFYSIHFSFSDEFVLVVPSEYCDATDACYVLTLEGIFHAELQPIQ